MALKWSKHNTGYDGPAWIASGRYYITYLNNLFVCQMFHEGQEIGYKMCNTLKQAKRWCERKERKRLNNGVL